MDPASTAPQLFREGYSCSQALLAAYAEQLDLLRETALKISAGFAAGMRQGEACGAVTAAFMILGLRHSGDSCESAEGRREVNRRIMIFTRRFKEKYGSIICRDLLGHDVGSPEGMRQAREKNLFRVKCLKIVEDTAAILDGMEAENPSGHDEEA